MSTEEKSCDLVCHLDKDYYRLVDHLSKLPHKILQFHHLDSLLELILHELSGESGFRLKKAVYLVDNPDFDHLVGAAGFSADDELPGDADMWNSTDSFQGACFHQEVKKISRQSLKRKNDDFSNLSEDIKEIVDSVGIRNPQVFSWPMKHGNHGILIFEGEEELSAAHKNLLSNSVALLSLCGM